MPKAAIVIVTWNSAKDIEECLNPLMDLPENWEIWVSDNGSKDNTVNLVKQSYPRVKISDNKENLGFAKGCNKAIEKTDAEYVLLLNPDTIGDSKTLIDVLNEAVKTPNLGGMGIKIFSEDGQFLTSCFPFPTVFKNAIDNLGLSRFFSKKWLADNLFDNFFDHQSVKKVDWVAGCFILMPMEVLDKIGNVPDDYFMFGDDIDLCYRIWQAGYEVVFYPQFGIKHKGSKSVDQVSSIWRVERTLLSKYAFCSKYYGSFQSKLIQFTDYLGFKFGRLFLRVRKINSPLIAEWKMYQTISAKALKMNQKEMIRVLNITPEQVNTGVLTMDKKNIKKNEQKSRNLTKLNV